LLVSQWGKSGRRRLKTNLSFASLVTREWLRRRVLAEAARRGAAPRAGAARADAAQGAGVAPPAEPGWAAAPVRAVQTEEPAKAGWVVDPEHAVDPEWAAEFEPEADRDRAR
jgi:hypothetical protein